MVGLIDSGIGGLFVLSECIKLCPNQSYLYFADNKNIPYGNKSKRFLTKTCYAACKKLITYGCNVIIFACNTLTAVCIKKARKKFKDIVFIGIEPAIKQAVKTNKKVLVLTTIATYKHSKLLKSYKNLKDIIFLPLKNLASDIESNLNKIKNVDIRKHINIPTTVDAVVLGCTHYNFVRSKIKTLLKVSKFYEASFGVAKRLSSFLKEENVFCVKFLFSGECKSQQYKSILIKLIR